MQISYLALIKKKGSPNCKKLNIGYVVHPLDDRPKELDWAFSNDSKYIIKWFEGPVVARVLEWLYAKIQDFQYKMLLKVLMMLFVVNSCSKIKGSGKFNNSGDFPGKATFDYFCFCLLAKSRI